MAVGTGCVEAGANYVLPTGQDVYVERAPAAAVILDKETAAGRVPSVDSANPPLVTTSARCWERYCALTAASVGPQDGLIFLHARTSRRGKRWLLAVRITSHGSNTIGIDSTVVDVADPRNVHGSTAFLFHGVTFFGSELQPTTATIRGGEPDASNSSRFTCQVAVGDLIGTLSGVIDDDGSFDPELRMDDSPR
jgi:hypothetical protein